MTVPLPLSLKAKVSRAHPFFAAKLDSSVSVSLQHNFFCMNEMLQVALDTRSLFYWPSHSHWKKEASIKCVHTNIIWRKPLTNPKRILSDVKIRCTKKGLLFSGVIQRYPDSLDSEPPLTGVILFTAGWETLMKKGATPLTGVTATRGEGVGRAARGSAPPSGPTPGPRWALGGRNGGLRAVGPWQPGRQAKGTGKECR